MLIGCCLLLSLILRLAILVVNLAIFGVLLEGERKNDERKED